MPDPLRRHRLRMAMSPPPLLTPTPPRDRRVQGILASRFWPVGLIFGRGCVLVCLVSLNTRLIADHRTGASVGVAMLISGVWWLNARASSRPLAPGGVAPLAYAVGAGVGTILGLWIGSW